MRQGTKRAQNGNYFGPTDPSLHMLGLPRSRPRLGNWGLVAILAGTLLALAVIVFENYFVSLF
jgi:hypothetical protein